jgi:PEP-CTERM motif
MRLNYVVSAAVAALTLSCAGLAHAVTIDFSFTNTIGNISGTVTGQIDGLIDNSTSAATAVWIDSYPDALPGGANASYPTPFDVFDWANLVVVENSFTLSNGVLVDGALHVGNTVNIDQLYLNSQCCTDDPVRTSFLDIGTNDTLYVWTQAPLNAPGGLQTGNDLGGVPEPAAWALMILGFGAAGSLLRRRRLLTA